MTKQTKLRIHVCPIGYEVDRVVLAAKSLRADRVWLIIEKNPRKEKAIKFIKNVESKLKSLDIEVKMKRVDRNDLFDNLKGIKEIFVKESGNEMHVNVSAGSKIQAIAGMMACMLFRKEYSPEPYYVEPASHEDDPQEPLTTGLHEILSLPNYEIKKPSDNLIMALQIINDNSGKLSKTQMAKLVMRDQILESSNNDDEIKKGDYVKLDNRIMKPLKEWNYIDIERVGREFKITIRPEGKDVLKFLSPYKPNKNDD